MREIKFRAWEYVHERTSGKDWIKSPMVWKMNYSPNIYDREVFGEFSMVDLNAALNCGGDASTPETKHPTIFMQYIGLKDKNGKEIYEGDIIKLANNNWYVYWDDGENKWNVNGINTTIGYGLSLRGLVERCRVVGNIYENPELFEIKK